MPDEQAINEDLIRAKMTQDAAVWAQYSKLKLANGQIFSFDDRPYLVEPMSMHHKAQMSMKATGGGFSECQGILPTLHGLIANRYAQGALYLFPTNDDVQDYSKSRFGPLFSNNKHAIGKYVKSAASKGTDTSKLKIVNGKNLYLRGARLDPADEGAGAKTSTKLSGIQVDRVVFDEVDLIDPEAIPLALGRCGNASVDGVKGDKEVVYIANPSDEDRGIDLYWQKSDQRHWFRLCTCGEYTCAEIEFQNDCHKAVGIADNGKGYIRCRKCGKPLSVGPGQWIAQRPSNSELAGYHWSHLTSNYCDPAEILDHFTNPPDNNLGAVYRYELGLPYSSKEDKLRKQDVLACCGREGIPENHSGPCAIGVDNDDNKHVVILIRTGNERYEMIKCLRTTKGGFEEVYDLIRRFNIKFGVVDLRPNKDSSVRFQKDAAAIGCKIYLCEYKESPLQDANFNDNNGIVGVYRTGIFDRTHRIITNQHIILPRQSPVLDEFARQCCNCVKSRDEKRKDVVIYRYAKSGDQHDHYRSALNYAVIAADRVQKTNRFRNENKGPKYCVCEDVKM